MNYLVIVLIIFFIMVLFVLSLLIIHLYSIRPRREDKKDRAIIREIDKSLLNLHFEGLSAEDEALLRAKVEKPQWEQPKSDPETAGLDGPVQASKDVVQSDFDVFLLKHNELSIRFDKLEKQLRVPQKEVDNDILRTITNDYVKSIEDDLNTLFSPPRPPVSKEFLADFGIHKEDLFPPKHDSDCPICLSIEKVRNRKNLHIRQPKASWH